ncbi:Na+/H+ antiporter [Paenibacillus albiflavus]|uniref:Na+/H+ antiporter n=1 Tax=Paenibacillus albiflavus TaxID=2545760 RepID=A0A4R4DYL4_9BACL|nr:Na+/H+ antiporter [Paenibacillus albiflavus]TCZ70937.1 Na+/H+ antiporter [Paenibacillus albiflavus]
METFSIVLLLLALIGVSSILKHVIPFIPVPLVQIALGIVIAVLPLEIHVPMETELFLVLFIAPLLFNDGRHVPRSALWKLRVPILLLALGLVFITVYVIGYLIHWLIPTIPLPAAFALAAILSPTDVVAVSAMSGRVKMPKDVMHLLEGEGLMNDASGLVAFKFAVAAMVTGVFSLAEASMSFLLISIGGFLGGMVLAFIIIRFRVFIRRYGMEDVTIHMLIQIMTPFVIYLAAEHFHLSGILAVVAAGIVHAIEKDREKSPSIELQVVSKSTWTVILYILNGLVFVLLGLQIPSVLNEILKNPQFSNVVVIKYILIITAALLLLRFVWVFGSWWGGWIMKHRRVPKPDLRAIGITTISGVRGAVTLAGSFSIPLVLNDGSPFPERALIIFIAAGVILLTLIAASIFLPMIAKSESKRAELEKEAMEQHAYMSIKAAAILAIRDAINDQNRSAALDVISDYNREMSKLKYSGNARDDIQVKKATMEVRLKALEAEADYIEGALKENTIDLETAILFQEYIQRMEMAVTNQVKFRLLFLLRLLKNILLRLGGIFTRKRERLDRSKLQHSKLIKIKTSMSEAAICELKKNMTLGNKEITYEVIGEYNEMLTKLKLFNNAEAAKEFARYKRELLVKAFQTERDEVQTLYENGQITSDILRGVRRQINIREAYWMEESALHV